MSLGLGLIWFAAGAAFMIAALFAAWFIGGRVALGGRLWRRRKRNHRAPWASLT